MDSDWLRRCTVYAEPKAAARRDISRALCERFLADTSPEELIGLLGASCDYDSAAAQRAAVLMKKREPTHYSQRQSFLACLERHHWAV